MKIVYDGGAVSGQWHGEAPTALVLAHGAGGSMHTPQLKAIADGLVPHAISTLRFNFPYAEAGRRAPDRAAVLEACYRAVAAHAAERCDRVFLGGRSMGGRMASHIVAQGTPADGLVFLAYPLHAPATPEKLRDEHLYRIGVPMLFVQGTRDTFARRDLFDAVVARLPNATVHTIEGADHGHKVAGRAPRDVNDEIVDVVANWITRVKR